MTTTYRRRFTIDIAHFNDGAVYDLWRATVAAVPVDLPTAVSHVDALLKCVAAVHGHTLDVEIAVTGPLVDNAWVVDDDVLRGLVERWDRKNLSVLSEFRDIRATTENISWVLADLVVAACPTVTRVHVVIGEGSDISAEHTWTGGLP